MKDGLTEHEGRTGVWTQGDCVFIECNDPILAVNIYRNKLADGRIAISTHLTDGQRARAAFSALRKAWHFLEQIQRGARTFRKELPDQHPARMKLLTLETMASIGLLPKERLKEGLKPWVERLEAMMRADEEQYGSGEETETEDA